MTETNVQLNRVVFEDDKEKERPAGSGNEETAPEGENQQEQPRNDGGDTADNQRREELDNGKENQQQTKEAADDGEGKVEATTSKSPEAQVLNVLLSALEQLGLIQVSQQPAPEPESNGDDGDGDGGMMDQRTITVKVPRVATMERGLSDKAPLAELNRVAGQVKDLSDELKRIAGRLDLLERAPAGEGPFAFDPTAAGVSSDSLAITQIRRFIDAEPDPQRRQAYERQLSEIMIANERRQGGHSLSLNS